MYRLCGRGTIEDERSVASLGYDRLNLLSKAMGAGLWDYNIETDSLYCSDRWYEIVGLSAKTTPISTMAEWKAYIHPEDREVATKINIDQVSELLAKDELYHAEFRIVRPSGETRWVRSVGCIIRDADQHLRAVGCITEMAGLRDPPTGICDGPMNGQTEALLSARERECLLWSVWEKPHGRPHPY